MSSWISATDPTTKMYDLFQRVQSFLPSSRLSDPLSEILSHVEVWGALVLAWTVIQAIKWIEGWFTNETFPELVVEFPEEISPSWTSRIISSPSLTSHLSDPSLLPPSSEYPPFPRPDNAGEDDERDRKHVTCYDPATAYHISTLPLPTPLEITHLISLANTAFSRHRQTTFIERRRFLRCLKSWLVAEGNLRNVVRIGVRDTGKTEVDATFGEILTVLSKIDYLLQHGEKALQPEKRPGNLLLAHKVSKVHYEPLGVVCAIVSWNYPIHNALAPILASLFTGNTVVIKCSENVYWSTKWTIEVVKKALRVCGMDPDAVQLVCCYPEDAESVTKNPLIKHITFIGSEPVGKIVAQAAATNLTPTCIELGGKDCAILLPSADVSYFSSTFMRAAFQANGQNCIGIERFIVHRSLYDSFVQTMKGRVEGLRCGPPLYPGAAERGPVDCGAMISDRTFGTLERMLGDAEKEGANVLVGGKRLVHHEWTEGHYFEPTLVVDVTREMEIAMQEVFAPIMIVLPYDTVDEAILIANSTRYGLGSAIFGSSRSECRSVADRLSVGMVALNDFGVFYLNQAMPFGGVNASGYGRFGGPEGLRGICAVKSISEDRLFKWVRTKIPGPVDYPLPKSDKSWMFLKGLVGLAYAPSWWGSIKGLRDLVRGSV